MKTKAISLLSSVFLFFSIIAFTPIDVNSAVLINDGPTCESKYGGKCECESGQNCEAGVFKCKCTTVEQQ